METCLLSDPATQFHGFAGNLPEQSVLRQKITSFYRQAEPDAVAQLLTLAKMNPDTSQRTNALAVQIAQRLRDRKNAIGRAGLVQGLLQEYALSSKEGVALMCLAEALLRIPDAATRDALMSDMNCPRFLGMPGNGVARTSKGACNSVFNKKK